MTCKVVRLTLKIKPGWVRGKRASERDGENMNRITDHRIMFDNLWDHIKY